MWSRQDQGDMRATNLHRTGSTPTTGGGVLDVKLVKGDEDIDTMQVNLRRASQIMLYCCSFLAGLAPNKELMMFDDKFVWSVWNHSFFFEDNHS